MWHQRVKVGEFKAKCLKLMDEVSRTGESLIITKRGKPVAKLRPIGARKAELLGLHQEAVRIQGDTVTPTGEAWEAEC